MLSPMRRVLPDDLESLEELSDLANLALDLRWSWRDWNDPIWTRLDPELWARTHNPWLVLHSASLARIEALARDPGLRPYVDSLVRRHREALGVPGWFRHAHPDAPLGLVAYFSMEFGLGEALPIYAGGLGILAGDVLKSASDLDVPVVGVGLLYQRGYFRQVVDPDGGQRALYPYNDPGQLQLTPVRSERGDCVRIAVELPGRTLWLRTWQAEVGRVRLYLLDSNDPGNTPADRGLLAELYGGGPEVRLQQEMVLGLGGWQLLQALGIRPEVCHLNEGHAAFVVLERARTFAEEHGVDFATALTVTRAGNVFTTHTPVPAGFDHFPRGLVRHYLGAYAERLGIGLEGLLALGRANANDPDEPLNMAYLAIRGSNAINGVSRLHGAVSRQIFARLFPRWPLAEIPVGHVTNGVHVPSWESAAADAVWTQACGGQRWQDPEPGASGDLRAISDASLWTMRNSLRRELVDYVRARLASQLAAAGASPDEIRQARDVFDPEVLTVGFARRFATYKRPTLLLHDPERLRRLLADPVRPVQLVLAGKPHPHDRPGQELVRTWLEFLRHPAVRRRAVFLADYDMQVAEHLVQGVDVWLNVPRRPMEASGTSGMKVLANGGLNLSTLDGWWDEAYSAAVGWAIDGGDDAGDAEALFRLLEEQVVPTYYDRGPEGIPHRWVALVRESMARLTPAFSSNRMVRDYTERLYLPAARAYRARSAQRAALGAAIARWRDEVARHWSEVRVEGVELVQAGDRYTATARIALGGLAATAVRVELYADPLPQGDPERWPLRATGPVEGCAGVWDYRGEFPTCRPAAAYTLRVIPYHPAAVVPLEASEIVWQG